MRAAKPQPRTAAWSGVAGTAGASRADITLTNHASWIGEAFYVTNVNVDSTSSWTIPDDSIVYATLTNAGLVQFTPPDAYKQLYVGSYVGAGGTLGIHTFLGDDNSPTDRLVIDGGTASGHGLIAVANIGGSGALTSADGIPVVEVLNGGTTNPGTFSLAGPVVAGPYEYTLDRGGVSAGTGDYWFLRSTLPSPPPPAPPAPPRRRPIHHLPRRRRRHHHYHHPRRPIRQPRRQCRARWNRIPR